MQFRVIMVTDPQTNEHSHKTTNREDRLQYATPLSLAHSVITGTSV